MPINQRMWQHSLFRDGKGNFEFTIVMYHPDNGQRSYKPQTKHAERMILPSSSQNTCKHTFEFTRAEKQTAEKVKFHHHLFLLSHAKLLTSIAYKLKQLLSYFINRMTSLSSQQSFSACLSANWQEWQFWLTLALQSSNTTPFWATHKRSRFRLVPIAHAQFTCNCISPLFGYHGCIEVLNEFLLIQNLVSYDCQGEFLPTCTRLHLP